MRPHLATLVEDFRRHGAQTAVVVYRGNRRYATSYAELANLTGRFSAELGRRGIGPGERVVLWGENSAEWIAAFFGCLLRGVVAVPLDLAGSPAFAARVIADVVASHGRRRSNSSEYSAGNTATAGLPRLSALAGRRAAFHRRRRRH